MLQGFLKTRNSSWLNKILAPKDLLSLLHAYVATQWLELWSNKKSAGFTFSCFLGMPVLASEPCLSPPLLRFCGCWGFLFPLPRSRVTGAAAGRAASLPGHPAGHGMAQQLGGADGFTFTGLISTAGIAFEYLFSSIFNIWILNQANPPFARWV